MQAAGKLQTAPGEEHDFTSDDLQDLGEIGRGAYGAVNKMIFRRTNTVMAGELNDEVQTIMSYMILVGQIKLIHFESFLFF